MEKKPVYRVLRLVPLKDFWGSNSCDLAPASLLVLEADNAVDAQLQAMQWDEPAPGDVLIVERQLPNMFTDGFYWQELWRDTVCHA